MEVLYHKERVKNEAMKKQLLVKDHEMEMYKVTCKKSEIKVKPARSRKEKETENQGDQTVTDKIREYFKTYK